MSTKGKEKKKAMTSTSTNNFPWNYGRLIARATGYSRALVYKVAQGKHNNDEVQRLLDLASADRLAFAQELEKISHATRILQNI